ncbi:YcxB family protein [uncultured Massilia sp.]|uniref:YcxB family protein n=1 Tax=uncultured Massilia sp. TaxID=169973 RepID=UPI0025D483AD|nr:YcxB family protein [uncultured Massilia sp.]
MLWSHRARAGGNVDGGAALLEQPEDLGADAMPAAPIPVVHPPAALCSLHFWVRYTLGEYTGFMWEHGGYLIRRRHIRWPLGLWLRLKSTLSAATHFMLLRRGRRTYEFQIDQHGIVRTSDTGVSLIGWDDVQRIRTYSKGFMMVLKRGTLPIPFRCLNKEEVSAMRGIAEARAAGELKFRAS